MPWQIPVTSFTWSSPLPTPREWRWGAKGHAVLASFPLHFQHRHFCLSSVIRVACLLSSLTPRSLLLCVSPAGATLPDRRSRFSKLKKPSFPKWDSCTNFCLSTEVPSDICSMDPILHLLLQEKVTVYSFNTPTTVHHCTYTQVSLLPHFISVENWNPIHSSKAISNATSFSKLCHHPPNRQDFSWFIRHSTIYYSCYFVSLYLL